MRDPEQIARSWLLKARQERDVFDQFISLWIAFNAVYAELEHTERSSIREFVYKRCDELERFGLRRLLENSHAQFFAHRVIRDVRGGVDTFEQAALLAARDCGWKKRLSAMLMVLYQVRCNLFHGGKAFAGERDQEVVGHAAAALLIILEAVLTPESGDD